MVMGQVKSQAWLAGNWSIAFEAAALGERLRLWLPVMSEAGAPLYLSKSTPVLRYSGKPKDEKLIELIVETVEATTVSPSLKGFLRWGFLGPTSTVLVISPKPEWSREVKNLECLINFVTRGVRSSQGKDKGTLVVM
jgi:hypothetical protein